MQIKDIEVFLTIVNTGAISRAADVLFMSQSTVSQSLSQLEAELGFPLVIRRKGIKNIQLTDKGTEFLSIADSWMQLNNATLTFAENPRSKYLSIGAVDTVVSCTFEPFFNSLIQNNSSDTDYSILIYNTKEIYRYIEEGRLDAGIGLMDISGFNVEVSLLLTEPMFLVSAETLPARVDPSELDPEQEVYLGWSEEYIKWHSRIFYGRGHAKLTVSTLPLMVSTLKVGGYWAVVPASVAEMFCNKYGFSRSRLTIEPPYRNVYLIRPTLPFAEARDNINDFALMLEEYASSLDFREI